MTANDNSTREAFAKRQGELLRFYDVRARSRSIDIARPRMRIHTLEAGEGEPLILIHGGDGEGAIWAPLMAELQDDFRLYALDRPGCGLSDPFDYRGVDIRRHAGDFVTSALDALGLASATLVSCSMGGFFALAAALDHPDRVRRLAFVGMPVGMSRSAPLPLRVIAGVPGLSKRFMRTRASVEAQRAQYKRMFGMDPDLVPEPYLASRVAGVAIPATQDTWAVLLRRIAGLRGIRPGMYLGEELAEIDVPTLVLWGEHDMAPLDEGRRASARIAKAQFVAMMGLGHHPFLEAPAETARLIRDFVEPVPEVRIAADALVTGRR
ncbi:MAG: alpha/beta hydrolase [Solirubrobacteraceae bacterium]